MGLFVQGRHAEGQKKTLILAQSTQNSRWNLSRNAYETREDRVMRAIIAVNGRVGLSAVCLLQVGLFRIDGLLCGWTFPIVGIDVAYWPCSLAPDSQQSPPFHRQSVAVHVRGPLRVL